MRVLVGRCFGIGNAVMSVPMLKALHGAGHRVEVLIGNTSDDVGTREVMFRLMNDIRVIDAVHMRRTMMDADLPHDVAIMSIPFDGRWQNGVHFLAKEVVDGRSRPDPSTTGLVSWKMHEVEYQMETARTLGHDGPAPDCSFFTPHASTYPFRTVYLGVGYKKDEAGFWRQKHWGNENFVTLVRMILADNPTNRVVTTGDVADVACTIAPIVEAVADSRFRYVPGGITQSYDVVADCHVYVGNDTGMMHVAASAGKMVLGLFFMENSIVKSRPWCPAGHVIDGVGRTVSPDEVFTRMKTEGFI